MLSIQILLFIYLFVILKYQINGQLMKILSKCPTILTDRNDEQN